MFLAGGNYDAYTNPQSSFGRGRNPRRRQDLPPLLGVSGGQFGQMQMGQVSGPSLEEVLSQRGFKVPEMKTGVEASIHLMYKDPLTGEMTGGGPHAASHARAMSDFYAKNPEALSIAKQHQKGQQFQGSGPKTKSIGDSLRPPQEIMPQPIQFSNGRPMSGTGQPTPPDPNTIRQGGGGIGGLQQFMQIMQMIMQMVQQFQGGGMGGMGMGIGGMRRNNFAQPQRLGGFNQYQSQQQNFNNPYGPY